MVRLLIIGISFLSFQVIFSQNNTFEKINKLEWGADKAKVLLTFAEDSLEKYHDTIYAILSNAYEKKNTINNNKLKFDVFFLYAKMLQGDRELNKAKEVYHFLDSINYTFETKEEKFQYLKKKAHCFRMSGDNKVSIEILYEAIDIAEHTDSLKKQLFFTYYELGNSYLQLENSQEAIANFENALKNTGDHQVRKAYVYNSLGIVYLDSFLIDTSKVSVVNQSIFYSQLADSILTAENSLANIAHVKRNLANALSAKGGQNEYAYKLHLEVLKLDTLANDKYGTMLSYKNLASVSNNLKKYKEAIQYAEKAVNLSREIGDQVNLFKSYYSLAFANKGLGRYKLAYTFLDSCRTIENRVEGIQVKKEISELKVKYELVEKENQLLAEKEKLIRAESEKKEKDIIISRRNMWLAYMVIFILILIFLIFFVKQKTIQKKEKQTAQLLLEEKNRGLEAMFAAQERERSRIAKDLHDGVGQQLSAIKLAISTLSDDINKKNQAKDEKLVFIKKMVDKSATEIRSISHQMMSATLKTFGLEASLKSLLEESFSMSNIDYDFSAHNLQDRYEEKVELTFFRIAQELINNIIKHADATKVSMRIYHKKNRLFLRVEDDGVGMDNITQNGYGLINLKSRLDTINGEIQLVNGDKGLITTVSVSF